MNRLISLSDKEFSLHPTKKGKSLCVGYKGVSFVLFYSSRCTKCGPVISVFNELSKKINNCNFCIINIDTYPVVVEASKNSICPIEYVPNMILYVNGRPFLKYQGGNSINEIGNFIMNVLNNLNKNKSFNENSVIETDKIETIGGVIPFNIVCEGDMCYLTSGEAYGKQETKNNSRTGNYSDVNDSHKNNMRMMGQDEYKVGPRQNLNGMYNPNLQQNRNLLNNISGM